MMCDVWGNPIVEEETVPNVLRYSGEYWDTETGLQYLRARWYDPNIGRFINEDTYEGEKDKPGTLNLYAYVQGNPLIYVDPSGNKQEMSSGGGGGGGFFAWPTLPGIKNLQDAVTKAAGLTMTSYVINDIMRNKKKGNKLFLYHATSLDHVDSVLDGSDVEAGRSNLDFGQGFYTTNSIKQAEAWIKNKFKGKGAIVVYAIDAKLLDKYNGRNFKTASEAADFI